MDKVDWVDAGLGDDARASAHDRALATGEVIAEDFAELLEDEELEGGLWALGEAAGEVTTPEGGNAVLLPELLDCLGGGTALGRDLEEDLDDVEWGGQSTSSHAGNEAADEILVLVELLLLLGCWGGRKEDVISGG